LQSKLPQAGTSQSGLSSSGIRQNRSGLAAGEPSQQYLDTKKASTDFNALLDGILGVVEAVRQYPPTERNDQTRIWGPFPTPDHPGFEARLVINRVDDQNFTYAIDFNRQGGDAWFAVLTGAYRATTTGLRKGQGSFALLAKAMRDGGLMNTDLDALEKIEVSYVTDRYPIEVAMHFVVVPGHPSTWSEIGYEYKELEDTSGAMTFNVKTTSAEMSEVQTTSRWLKSGAGRADVLILEGTYEGAAMVECWDETFNITYAKQSWLGGQSVGAGEHLCPTFEGL
jgi:hypothetical protein